MGTPVLKTKRRLKLFLLSDKSHQSIKESTTRCRLY